MPTSTATPLSFCVPSENGHACNEHQRGKNEANDIHCMCMPFVSFLIETVCRDIHDYRPNHQDECKKDKIIEEGVVNVSWKCVGYHKLVCY